MSAPAVILAALTSTEAQRAATTDDLAALVADALADSNLLTEIPTRRCRSLLVGSGAVERYLRCTYQLRHTGDHSGQVTATTTVTWTDEQAAGVLRERI